jgi:hypothetical protein
MRAEEEKRKKHEQDDLEIGIGQMNYPESVGRHTQTACSEESHPTVDNIQRMRTLRSLMD